MFLKTPIRKAMSTMVCGLAILVSASHLARRPVPLQPLH
jgi:hypothetical protein